MTAPVYELAGQQTDPLAEEVLAILFSDRPVRSSIRPGDTRRHWQWWAREPIGSTSRLWLSFAEPITDTTTTDIKTRGEAALAVLIPTYATAVTVTATQTAHDTIALDVLIKRPRQQDLTVGLTLTGNPYA